MSWRVGGKVPLNVYEDDLPMFQCHTPEDAQRVVDLLNREPLPCQPAGTPEGMQVEKIIQILAGYHYHMEAEADSVDAKESMEWHRSVARWLEEKAPTVIQEAIEYERAELAPLPQKDR